MRQTSPKILGFLPNPKKSIFMEYWSEVLLFQQHINFHWKFLISLKKRIAAWNFHSNTRQCRLEMIKIGRIVLLSHFHSKMGKRCQFLDTKPTFYVEKKPYSFQAPVSIGSCVSCQSLRVSRDFHSLFQPLFFKMPSPLPSSTFAVELKVYLEKEPCSKQQWQCPWGPGKEPWESRKKKWAKRWDQCSALSHGAEENIQESTQMQMLRDPLAELLIS